MFHQPSAYSWVCGSYCLRLFFFLWPITSPSLSFTVIYINSFVNRNLLKPCKYVQAIFLKFDKMKPDAAALCSELYHVNWFWATASRCNISHLTSMSTQSELWSAYCLEKHHAWLPPFSHLLPGTAAGKSPKSSQRSVRHVCSHMRREHETRWGRGACRCGLFSKGSAEDVLRGWGVERALCTPVWISPRWDTAKARGG